MKVSCRRGIALLLANFILASAAMAATEQSSPVLPAPVPVPIPTPTGAPQSASLWVGGEVGPSSWVSYLGGVYSLNGDLSADGFLLRGGFTFGEYDNADAEGQSDVSFQNANVLIGYQQAIGAGRVAFYVGPDFTHSGSRASSDVRGGSWGVRGIADLYVPVTSKLDLSSWATYSTIESQYFVSLQTRYRVLPNFRIGPEVALLGGDRWKQNRIGAGAAVAIPIGEVGLGVGHVWDRNSGGEEGVYVNAILSVGF